LLFDGVCNLCNGYIQDVIKRDKEGIYRFASLQSDLGQNLVSHFKLENLDSVFLLDNGEMYIRSDVAFAVAKRLGGLYTLLSPFKIVPLTIRNKIYDWIARNRYHWFGKQEECMIPTPELKALFIA